MTADGPTSTDVLVDGDTIKGVGHFGDVDDAVVIDASGAVLGPGFVDLHVHFREPGQTWKEDVESGSRAAAAGGYTAVVAMPNTEPSIDSPEVAASVLAAAKRVGVVTLAVAGALTKRREGMEPADLEGLHGVGVRMFSDDGDCVADRDLLEQVMVALSGLPEAFVSEHAEDVSMTSDGHLHEGEISAQHGLGGMPAAAEDRMVERDIQLSDATGCRLHIQHVSSAGSVELIRRAKATGSDVTAEVTPHHLALQDRDLETLDANLKMYPPLRSPEDRAVLVAALRDGTIDVVATDHAPHANEEKEVGFENAPRGAIGLETAASVAFAALEGELVPFFDRMSVAPARIGRFERHGRPVRAGEPANLVLWSSTETWVPSDFASKSANSPFLGRPLQGRVLATVHEGALVYGEGIHV